MSKILVYSNNKSDTTNIINPLVEVGYFVSSSQDYDSFIKSAEEIKPDIIIIAVKKNKDNISKICRKIRLIEELEDVQIILVFDENIDFDSVSQTADGYITRPINQAILFSTINAHLRTKNHLDVFSSNNNELAKRFYQLNVLYDTNSKLAGTLNPRKLINIMNDGLEQSISYALSTTLIINNPDDIILLINSMYPITKRLEQALKMRTVLTYKSMYNEQDAPINFDVNDLKTEIAYKQDDDEYDFEVMHYESIFAPIATQDKFFGTVEIMRESELSKEDTTCFQTLVSQVALPLASAILYEEIQEKNIRLEKLEKLKSEFVSIVSHELRTPLTAIKNALDIILSGKTGDITDKMSNFLNMGKRNVTRLAGIINDLLDLSKIEAGKMEYRFEKIDLLEPINLVLSTFKPLAQNKNINLISKINTDKAFVYADIQKLEQILTNLVSNALKFTSENGKVTIVLSEYKKDNNYYLVEVKDNGIGISEENLSKVFDKFQQIENSLSRKVGGTGLGLPIAKELVLSHRGNIWVDSIENKGTTFSFTMPKYNEYTNFLLELDLFYEKSKNVNTNFAIMKFDNKNATTLVEYIKNENKYRKMFIDNDYIYLITQTFNKNLYEIYLEKLKDFLAIEKNDNILLKAVYCDFDENISIKELVSEFEKA